MSKKILVIGTLAFDSIQTPFFNSGIILGGAATYISFAISKISNNFGVVSVVGDDFPLEYLDKIKLTGADVSGVEIVKNKESFFWSGKYHKDINKRTTLETRLGVLENFNPIIPKKFLDSDIVVLGNLHPSVQNKSIIQLSGKNQFLILDTMNFWMDNNLEDLNEVISKVNLISINDEEAYLLAKEKSLDNCAYKIINKGPQYVIIKKGELGAELYSKDEKFSLPSFKVEAIDPTGAGDSFAGGLATYLSKSNNIDFNSLKKGLILGTILASFTVESLGTKSIETVVKKKILERLEMFLIKNKIDLNLSI
ncbi:MAG: sugar kinase [Flavobacteriaceae bacterium]|nr:sugar kinase [Flavobacteriaceae bacterium]|tara:strand:+ start:389 stop:1318 length:930 start_codon:yes stop_codon:yes gene_type:complete